MKNKKRSAVFSTPVKLAVALILAVLVILPIIRMFSGIRVSDFQAVFASPLFGDALKNSVVLSLIATVISVLLAYVLALCTVRTDMPGKRIFGVLLTLPMLIPSISHGIGLTTLFGNNGIVTQLLGTPAIYGPVGIVTGSVMYAFPVAYIMLSDVLKYEAKMVALPVLANSINFWMKSSCSGVGGIWCRISFFFGRSTPTSSAVR